MNFNVLLFPKVGLIFFQTVIMLSVYVLLTKYAWGPLLDFIKKEEEAYKKAKREEVVAREISEKLKKQSEGIIEKANEKRERIISRSLATKEAFLAEAREEMAKEHAKMVAQVNKLATKKEKEALDRAKDEIATLVINTTQKLLKLELQEKNCQDLLLQQLILESSTQKGVTNKNNA